MLFRVAMTFVGLVCWCGSLLAAGPAGVWIDVPFVQQEKDGCGAASIAMVMQYWYSKTGHGVDADAVQIQRALYSSRARGVYASDLERYFQQNGFQTFAFQGDWDALKQHLEKGRPLIAALKPAGGTPLHYVVITGLDSEQQLVLVNDPALRKLLKQGRSTFEKQWHASGNWTLLALPAQAGH